MFGTRAKAVGRDFPSDSQGSPEIPQRSRSHQRGDRPFIMSDAPRRMAALVEVSASISPIRDLVGNVVGARASSATLRGKRTRRRFAKRGGLRLFGRSGADGAWNNDLVARRVTCRRIEAPCRTGPGSFGTNEHVAPIAASRDGIARWRRSTARWSEEPTSIWMPHHPARCELARLFVRAGHATMPRRR